MQHKFHCMMKPWVALEAFAMVKCSELLTTSIIIRRSLITEYSLQTTLSLQCRQLPEGVRQKKKEKQSTTMQTIAQLDSSKQYNNKPMKITILDVGEEISYTR